MNIGILTLPLHCNYGGILQAYALQEFLKQEGHEVTLLNRQRNATDVNIGSRLFNLINQEVMHHNMQRFIRSRVHLTRAIESEEALREATMELDAVIVGSDQVWRLDSIKGVERNYFLDFVKPPCRRIAYAASFGLGHWEGTAALTQELAACLKRFDALSVREQDGIRLCKEVFGVEAQQVSDPTLLFDHTFYEGLIEKPRKSAAPTLFYYLLGNKRQSRPLIEGLAERLQLRPQTVNADFEVRIGKFNFTHFPTPDRWIEAIRHASFVVTDSFHGMVFALLFNKPFVVLENRSGGLSRIHSLLGHYGLPDRLVSAAKLESMTADQLLHGISYPHVNTCIEADRTAATEFLRQALR